MGRLYISWPILTNDSRLGQVILSGLMGRVGPRFSGYDAITARLRLAKTRLRFGVVEQRPALSADIR
jgi:hypothetical protein